MTCQDCPYVKFSTGITIVTTSNEGMTCLDCPYVKYCKGDIDQISDAKYEQYQYDRQHFTTDDLVGEKSSRGKE